MGSEQSTRAGPDRRLAIVTVHGTGDTAAEPDGAVDGEKWFQTKSRFARQLHDHLAAKGLKADVFAHLWSGANSASEREKGARALAKTVRRLARTHKGGVHLVGHSHGGNVANDAALLLNWSAKQKRPKLKSLSTIGTPFFRSHVTLSDRLGALMFALVVGLSVVMIPAITIFAGDAFTSAVTDIINMPAKDVEFDPAHAELQPVETPQGVTRPLLAWMSANALPMASALAVLVMLPIAFRGMGRIARAGRRTRADTKVFSIWHPNDEAIAFLTRLEGVPIEPFPRWSLFRGSRTGAILWGVRAIIAVGLIGAALLAADIARGVDVGAHPFQAFGTYVLIVGVAGAPLVFAFAYVLYRLFAAIVLELSLRGLLNNVIGGALIAMAFGRDGDHRIDKVASGSHYYATQSHVLSGETAERMLARSTQSAEQLFHKYRTALFSVAADESNAINELTTDALTWDSLIHTTYFEQPEVIDAIAEHIAAAALENADV